MAAEELKKGQMLDKQLAEWRGIKPISFSHHRAKYLEELKFFADFHLEGKKVYIDKVIVPCYEKQPSKRYKFVRDNIDSTWAKNGLDSCQHVGKLIAEKSNSNIAMSTAVNYTLKARNEKWGKPSQYGEKEGPEGRCKYIWCKKSTDGTLAFLTEEEEKIRKQTLKIYYGGEDENALMMDSMLDSGEITEDQAVEIFRQRLRNRKKSYTGFLSAIKERLGITLIRGTLVERGVNFELEECKND